jgi:hypothetical protein
MTGEQVLHREAHWRGVRLWVRWVAANTAAEVVGLGATVLVAVAGVLLLAPDSGLVHALAYAAVLVLAGTFLEGVVVGMAQWLVLRGSLPDLTGRAWIGATATGAAVAWMLGMVPSTFLSTIPQGPAVPDTPMSDALIFSLAALMGLVLGLVLATPQWWVLRRQVERAGWWIAANTVAWSVGMAIIFAGAGNIPTGNVGPGTVLWLLAMLAGAGATVGAIHGVVLVWLVRDRE